MSETEYKLYKGEVKTVEELEKTFTKPTPVQVKTKEAARRLGFPPSFMVTRFKPGWDKNTRILHFYDSKAKQVSYRAVPVSDEFNVLQGGRGAELAKEWEDAVSTGFWRFSQRINPTIGTDPEVFAVDKKGKVVPAWEYLKSKDNPNTYSTSDKFFYGTAYWDGFQAEFTTAPGITCLAQAVKCMEHGLKKVRQAAEKVGAKLTLDSVVPVDPDFLVSHGEKHPEHVAFGCAPSHNIYGLKGNMEEGRNVPFRFAGGHIHFGLSDHEGVYKPERLVPMVKAMDRVLGVACVSFFATLDNPIRRKFYGLPGEYRLPKHGLEYRVLSNAWLCHPTITHMVFDLARAAASLPENNLMEVWDTTDDETVEVITNHEVDKARAILKRNENAFKNLLTLGNSHYQGFEDLAYGFWLKGVESVVDKPRDISGNWFHWGEDSPAFVRQRAKLEKGKKV